MSFSKSNATPDHFPLYCQLMPSELAPTKSAELQQFTPEVLLASSCYRSDILSRYYPKWSFYYAL